jgi:hypothetical protein
MRRRPWTAPSSLGIVLGEHTGAIAVFQAIGKETVTVARDPDEAIAIARRLLTR